MKTIGEHFRQARTGSAKGQSLRRFAESMAMDHVHLTLIEKGQRFPNEDLVRRLARKQGDDPEDLVGVLWRDRIVTAIRRELRNALSGGGVRESDEPVSELGPTWTAVVARVVSALPDSGEVVALPRYRGIVREALRAERGQAGRADVVTLTERLEAQGLVERVAGGVRKRVRHFKTVGAEGRLDLALELAAIFAKGLTDKLFRGRTDSYVRNHFARIAPERIPDFQARLHAAIREVTEEFDAGDDPDGEQVRVLVAQVGDR